MPFLLPDQLLKHWKKLTLIKKLLFNLWGGIYNGSREVDIYLIKMTTAYVLLLPNCCNNVAAMSCRDWFYECFFYFYHKQTYYCDRWMRDLSAVASGQLVSVFLCMLKVSIVVCTSVAAVSQLSSDCSVYRISAYVVDFHVYHIWTVSPFVCRLVISSKLTLLVVCLQHLVLLYIVRICEHFGGHRWTAFRCFSAGRVCLQ